MDNNFIEKINEIKNNVDIVDVMSRYLTVIRKGKSYKAICPFHNDTNPSLSISQDKQIFKCFVCNAGGDVINFVSRYKKIPYINAVKEIADIAGVEFNVAAKKDEIIIAPKQKVLYDICQDAANFYMNSLKASKEALDYVSNREIDNSLINQFKIGYSKDNDSLIKFLRMKGYSNNDIYRSGIALEQNGELIDRFASRLIFPLADDKGQIIAFSGRVIGKSDAAKYVNSSESDIFVKGDNFYNYSNAIDSIKQNKRIYICEGYFDCIALVRAGITNAVALMGTAFTKKHLQTLKFLGCEVILCLDGDIPGNTNALKLANQLAAMDIKVKAISNYQEFKDLDELYTNKGKDVFIEHLNNSMLDLLDFNIIVAKRTIDFSSNENKKQFLYAICKKIAAYDDVTIDLYISKLHDELGFSTSTIKNLIKDEKNKTNNNINYVIHKYRNFAKNNELQMRILASMLGNEEAIKIYLAAINSENNPLYLEDNSYRSLAYMIVEYYQEHQEKVDIEHMLTNLLTMVEVDNNADELRNKLLEVDETCSSMPTYSKKSFEDLIFELRYIVPLEKEIKQIEEDINFETTIEKKNELIVKSINLKTKLNEFNEQRRNQK